MGPIAPGPNCLGRAGTAGGTALFGLYAVSAVIRFGWDAGVVAEAAATLADGGQLGARHLDYFAWFPNNVPLLFVEVVLARLGALVGVPLVAVLVTLQVVLVGVVLWSLGRTARVLGHPCGILPVQAVALLLIGLSPQVSAPYTDIPGAACVAVAVTAMTSASVASTRLMQGVWAAGAAASLAAGIVMKPYIVVVLVAVALVTLAVVCSGRSWALAGRAVAALGAGVALVAVTTTGLGLASQHGTGLTTDRLQAVRSPFPVELWLASGTYDDADPSPTRRYGAYNQQLVDAAAGIAYPQSRRQMLRDQVREQVTGRSVADNARFFGSKVTWVWGDGTFWASGEGTDSRQPSVHSGGPLRVLSEWTIATGEHYRLQAAVTQGIWLALLLITGLGLIGAPYRRLTTTWSLSLIGLTGYLMLFEARPRYLLALLPVLLALTSAGHLPRRR